MKWLYLFLRVVHDHRCCGFDWPASLRCSFGYVELAWRLENDKRWLVR